MSKANKNNINGKKKVSFSLCSYKNYPSFIMAVKRPWEFEAPKSIIKIIYKAPGG